MSKFFKCSHEYSRYILDIHYLVDTQENWIMSVSRAFLVPPREPVPETKLTCFMACLVLGLVPDLVFGEVPGILFGVVPDFQWDKWESHRILPKRQAEWKESYVWFSFFEVPTFPPTHEKRYAFISDLFDMKTMLSSRVESPIVLNHVKTKNNYIDHMIMFRF